MGSSLPELVIRRATLREAAVIAGLWTDFLGEAAELDDRLRLRSDAAQRWTADYPEWLQDTTRVLSVSALGNQIVGFVSGHLWGPEPVFEDCIEIFVEYLYVLPPFRRKGIGGEMVRHVVDWGANLGATRVRIKTPARSEDALRFWHSSGAEPAAVELTFEIESSGPARQKRPIGFRGNSR
jgi:GNAT superfamily N-acetyltransferase